MRETDSRSRTRIEIVEFPGMRSAQAFLDSEECAPAKSIRTSDAECTLFVVDGS